MTKYVCRLKRDRIAAFKKQWTQPQEPESWEAEIEAADEAEARQVAFGEFRPVGDRNPRSIKRVDSLAADWFECRAQEDTWPD